MKRYSRYALITLAILMFLWQLADGRLLFWHTGSYHPRLDFACWLATGVVLAIEFVRRLRARGRARH